MLTHIGEGHKVLSTEDESVRLFDNSLLNYFSKVHWWVPLVLATPVIIYFLIRSIFVRADIPHFTTFLLFVGGLALWTSIEYIFHRFIFHYEPTSALGKKIHFLMHGVHHAYPNDSMRLVMPPVLSIPLSTMFYFIFRAFWGKYAFAIFAGFLLGYLMYDMLHFATHHAHFIKHSWFKNIKKHHMRHHFEDPDNGFGVSSTAWDKLCGTCFRKKS